MSASEDSPPAAQTPAGRGRTSSRDAAALAAGSALSGVLAYVFFAVASRSLGVEAAAPVSVLWSYWAIAAAALTFPVQHWTIRSFAGDGHEAAVARALPTLAAVALVASLAAGVVTYVVRVELFGSTGVAFPAMVAAVTLGSFLTGLVRGVLSGRGRFTATAVSLAGENAVRVAAAAGVAAAGGGSEATGAALVAGSVVALWWSPSLRLSRGPGDAPRAGLGLVSGVAGGSLTGQVVLAGAPVLLAVTGGAPAEVTSLFLALAVWRAPYIVAMGMTPQLTGYLTRLVAHSPPARVRRVVAATGLALLAGAAVAAVLGATALGPVLRVAFGAGVELGRPALAGLGVGTVAALGNLVMLLMLLALGRSRRSTAAWVLALAVAASWVGLSPLGPVADAVMAFLLAETAALALLTVLVVRAAARAGGRAHAGQHPD